MITFSNNIAYNDGKTGSYGSEIKDEGTRYGRNAFCEYSKYLGQLSHVPDIKYPDLSNPTADTFVKMDKAIEQLNKYLKNPVPLNYQIRYMPQSQDGKINLNSALGEAYEEMGQKTEISTSELDNKMKEAFPKVEIDSSVLDRNGDKKIDVGEYATSVLLSDIFSTNPINPKISDVNGVITRDGMNETLPYINGKNSAVARADFETIYNYYNLGGAYKQFAQNPNNLIQN